MLASVHLADIGVRRALSLRRRSVDPASIAGLRWASPLIAQPLRSSFRPALAFKRLGLVTFWDDAGSLDAFESQHRVARLFEDGWRARLVPLRAFGAWPGLDSETPRPRHIDEDGPAVVLTLGRLRVSQAVRFLRTSAKAEAAARSAPGLIWASGLARPPFVATCSLWQGQDAIAAYAYGGGGAHPGAISVDRAKAFHHESAFIRFRPVAESGGLAGRNPLPAGSLGLS